MFETHGWSVALAGEDAGEGQVAAHAGLILEEVAHGRIQRGANLEGLLAMLIDSVSLYWNCCGTCCLGRKSGEPRKAPMEPLKVVSGTPPPIGWIDGNAGHKVAGILRSAQTGPVPRRRSCAPSQSGSR